MKRTSALSAVIWLVAVAGLSSAPQQAPRKASPESEAKHIPADAGRETPSVPVEEIIRRFAGKEAEFKEARGNYTYRQSVHVREYDAFGHPGGEFLRTSEIIFSPGGKRYERITREPPSTLRMVSLSREDIEDLENIQPFVLTTEDLPKYNLEYQRREPVDEITTYVFRVTPKRMERGQRYFEGLIWVDDRDLQIVKTYGKAVPDIRHGNQENLFPRFETYRENIDGKYWFPTYTHADDLLRFRDHEVRIRMIVRYSDYKQFKSTIKIIPIEPAKPDQTKPPTPPRN